MASYNVYATDMLVIQPVWLELDSLFMFPILSQPDHLKTRGFGPD